jgi:hypothetical protein
MTDTTCPRCDAPAPAGARGCSRCGYRFIEGGAPRPPLPRPGPVALGATAIAALALAAVLLVGGRDGGGDERAAGAEPVVAHLQVLAKHPLSTRAAERLLEDRYFPVPDDDESDVGCSERIPKPAHSVRRCTLRYPGGTERTVVLLTTANGAEVLSKP